MGNKANESRLMEYLYGNLSEEEKRIMEVQFQQDPERLKELEDFKEIRKMLGKVQDKNVPEPILMPVRSPKNFWQENFFRYAATISLILGFLILLGKFTGLDMQFRESGLSLTFREADLPEMDREAANRQIAMMVIQAMEERFQAREARLENRLEQELHTQGEVMKQSILQQQGLTEKALINLKENLHQQNQSLIQAYRQDLALTQEEYYLALMENLTLVMQHMREEEMAYIQAWMAGLKNDKDTFQQETEKILASLLYTVGNYQHE